MPQTSKERSQSPDRYMIWRELEEALATAMKQEGFTSTLKSFEKRPVAGTRYDDRLRGRGRGVAVRSV